MKWVGHGTDEKYVKHFGREIKEKNTSGRPKRRRRIVIYEN
jgi:hypothetical protein